MDIESESLDSLTVATTREVRWFFEGPLPSRVLDWFTSSGVSTNEHRVDHYDFNSARNGVGRKHRDNATLDTKFRLEVIVASRLAPGITGRVEDWVKVSEPLSDLANQSLVEPIRIAKNLHTRSFSLNEQPSGCEVELADVEVSGMRAWSLCFETFGDPALRGKALQAAVDRFFSGGLLPQGVELGLDSSIAYPDWISSLSLETV